MPDFLLFVLLGKLEANLSEAIYSTIKEAETEKPLTLDDLTKTMQEFRAKHGRPLKAIKVSEKTVHQIGQMFPVYPAQERSNTLYSVPIQIDNDLELWEGAPVYA